MTKGEQQPSSDGEACPVPREFLEEGAMNSLSRGIEEEARKEEAIRAAVAAALKNQRNGGSQ